MPWMPGVPSDEGLNPQGTISPKGVVAHRTYGVWASDYVIGKGTGGGVVGFHFLVGKLPGQWVQFYGTTTRCAHAGTNANGNDVSVAIEVEGRNDEPFTPWQTDRVRDIVSWLKSTHNIALEYRFSTAHDLVADHGYVPHSAVKGADHSDYWTVDDWQCIVGAAGSVPTPTTPRRRIMPFFVRRPNGTVYIVALSGVRAGIANPSDLAELQKAVADPTHVADVSQQTFDQLAQVADVNISD